MSKTLMTRNTNKKIETEFKPGVLGDKNMTRQVKGGVKGDCSPRRPFGNHHGEGGGVFINLL